MKIGIVGVGVVGGACKYGFEKLGHDVVCHDPRLGTTLEEMVAQNPIITFICVPTPSKPDGSCDTSIVRETVARLAELNYFGIVAIKSTVEPGTTELLIHEFGESLDICFVPEFLRERCAITDFTENHTLLAVGTEDEEVFGWIVDAHGKYPKHVRQLFPTEAELLKYYHNIFNACRVIFANEFYEVASALGAAYTPIKEAYMLLGLASDNYMDVNKNFRGYGGMCLPKDTRAIAALCNKLGLDMKLFETLEAENAKFKTTVFEGMRP